MTYICKQVIRLIPSKCKAMKYITLLFTKVLRRRLWFILFPNSSGTVFEFVVNLKEWRSEGAKERRSEGAKEWRSEGVKEWRSEGVKEWGSVGVKEWCSEIVPPLQLAKNIFHVKTDKSFNYYLKLENDLGQIETSLFISSLYPKIEGMPRKRPKRLQINC